ncbi:MAG: hypothetical protein PVG78_07170 [Desulfobacterales bacterium]
MSDEKKSDKEALKQLREKRKRSVDRAKKAIGAQAKIIKSILQAMGNGNGTVPEIASATGLPTAAVLLYVATLKKYGKVVEGAKDGDYFRYEPAQG